MKSAFIGKYVIVRTQSAGVHAGTLIAKSGSEVRLSQSRRLWKWMGALTLSELAELGTSNPTGCKFSIPLETIEVLGVLEIIPCSKTATLSITGVPEWTL